MLSNNLYHLYNFPKCIKIKETKVTNDKMLMRCLVQRFYLSFSNSCLWRWFHMFLGILGSPEQVDELMQMSMSVKLWRRTEVTKLLSKTQVLEGLPFVFENFLQLLHILDYTTTYFFKVDLCLCESAVTCFCTS